MKTALPPNWKSSRASGYLEYIRADGARVYSYGREAWGPQLWGAQAPNWPKGECVATSMRGAIEFIDKHYPAPTDEQFMAALGPCGK